MPSIDELNHHLAHFHEPGLEVVQGTTFLFTLPINYKVLLITYCVLGTNLDTVYVLCRFNHVQLFATLWTVACQALLSMGILKARILEWVAIPASRGSSQPRDQTQVSKIAGGFFT